MSLADLFEVGYASAPDGGRVAYGVAGSGGRDVVALGAGFFGFEATTESPVFVDLWQGLLRLGRVIALDARGIGRSDPMPPGYDDDMRVDDMVAVLDAAGVTAVDVIGSTMGAAVALLFAARYPRRVRSVVAMQPYAQFGTACGDSDGGVAVKTLMDNIRHGWGRGGFLMGPRGSTEEDDEAMRRVAARVERLSASPAAVEALFRAHARVDLRPELPRVEAPVLVLDYPNAPMTVRLRPDAARDVADRLADARYVQVAGARSMLDRLPITFEHIGDFLGADSARVPTRIVQTMLFTDVVKSTERAAELGDGRWRQLLDEHDRIVRDQVQLAAGRVVHSTGDGALATLPTPSAAVACATLISAALRPLGFQVRSGIHLGEVEVRGSDLGGIGVHIAARIAALASPGEVLISDTALSAATGSEVAAVDAGMHRLKGVPREWRLWRLAGTVAPTQRVSEESIQVATEH